MIAFLILIIYFAIEYLAIRNIKTENNPDFPKHIATSLFYISWPWWLFFVSAVYGGNRRKIFYSSFIGIIHSFSQTVVVVLCWDNESFPLGEALAIPGAIALLLSVVYLFWNKREIRESNI